MKESVKSKSAAGSGPGASQVKEKFSHSRPKDQPHHRRHKEEHEDARERKDCEELSRTISEDASFDGEEEEEEEISMEDIGAPILLVGIPIVLTLILVCCLVSMTCHLQQEPPAS